MAKKKQGRKVVRLMSTVSKYVYYTTEDIVNGALKLKKFDPTPGIRQVVDFAQAKKGQNLGRNVVKARKS